MSETRTMGNTGLEAGTFRGAKDQLTAAGGFHREGVERFAVRQSIVACKRRLNSRTRGSQTLSLATRVARLVYDHMESCDSLEDRKCCSRIGCIEESPFSTYQPSRGGPSCIASASGLIAFPVRVAAFVHRHPAAGQQVARVRRPGTLVNPRTKSWNGLQPVERALCWLDPGGSDECEPASV